jgi:hypothetical protein
MTLEEKNLLLQDLCARLPYGVILNCCNLVGEKLYTIDNNGLVNNDYDLEEVKPYLFPLSSMTEEQRKEFLDIQSEDRKRLLDALIKYRYEEEDKIPIIPLQKHIDWLNAHHFDYRGLIPMGLANDATGLNIY